MPNQNYIDMAHELDSHLSEEEIAELDRLSIGSAPATTDLEQELPIEEEAQWDDAEQEE